MRVLFEAGIDSYSPDISCELAGPDFEASALHTEVVGNTACYQFHFRYDASGPLVLENSPAKLDLDKVQSLNVVFSSYRFAVVCNWTTDRFTGKPVSATTGLYYYYHRWYDPSVGRFVSEDSLPSRLSDPQSSNKYGYVNNAPTTFTDPSGLGMVVGNGRLPCWDWFGLIPCHQGGVGGLVSATTTSLSTSPGGAPVIIAGIGLYLGAEVLYNVCLVISLLAPLPLPVPEPAITDTAQQGSPTAQDRLLHCPEL